MTRSPHSDDELRDWLRWGSINGPSFVRALAEAVSVADAQAYSVLRPALLELKAKYPQKG
jgi:hypothetical protein